MNMIPGSETSFDLRPQGPDGCIPLFYYMPKRNGAKSLAAGRPIFEDVAWVKILIPGDNKSEFETEVREKDKMRWPQQWAKFQAGHEQVMEGTLLEEWPQMTRSMVAELKHIHVHTVEQLATLSETGLQSFGHGARTLQKQAADFLRLATDASAMTVLRQDNENLEARIDTLTEQVQALLAGQQVAQPVEHTPQPDKFAAARAAKAAKRAAREA